MLFVPFLCLLLAFLCYVPLEVFGRRLPTRKGNSQVGVQEQVKSVALWSGS